jgi:5-methyltetrahydropteroyltriglutamate--homocysteine methyltransferase
MLSAELHFDRFLLEYDSDEFGGFEPLRCLPQDKTVVLGLVTSKHAELEDPDDLMRCIELAAKYCSIEQLALSPQCGFGGSADNDFMSYEQQLAKLANLSSAARRVWG